jgi:hypothetical protein
MGGRFVERTWEGPKSLPSPFEVQYLLDEVHPEQKYRPRMWARDCCVTVAGRSLETDDLELCSPVSGVQRRACNCQTPHPGEYSDKFFE